jgi:LuxR family maltose regulon positive regulatory protein
LAYLVAAVNSVGMGNAARQALKSPQPPPMEAIVSILLNEIAASPQTFTLVLDDYHAIHTPQIHKIMAFFLEHQPARVHLVLITREDPLLPVLRLRARGQVLEIRQEDLRFTIAEAQDFLSRIMKLDLRDADVALLERRTEGWIAGLQLAALALQGLSVRPGIDPRDFIQAFAGSSHFIIDYLIMEVFQQQPAEMQEFLLKTAILERMTGALCDEVAGRTGSRELLEHLDKANLFIIPLDQAREWYRYHHLFAEFLRHRLREQYSQALTALHQSAVRWYEANGFLSDAIEHALAAADWERAGTLIDKGKDSLLRRGEIATLLTWYGKLPEALVRSKLELCLGYAWPLLLSSQLERAQSLLASAELGTQEGSENQGNLFAVQAYLARSRGDHAGVITASERALALLPQTDGAARGILAVNLGIAYWHNGQLDETEKIMSEVQHVGSQTGNLYAVLTARFFGIRVLATRGQLRRAEPLYMQMILESGQTPITALAHFDLCTLYWEWNRLEEADQQLKLGMELSAHTGNAEFLSAGHILHAFILLAHSNPKAAWEEASLAYDLAREYSSSVRARSEAMHVRAALALGDIDLAVRWAEQMQARADAHPLYRFIDLARPRLLIAQGKKEEARTLLTPCCQAARQHGWGYALVATLVLLALAARTVDEALAHLAEALGLAQPEGYLQTFLDAGAGLAPLLQEAARRGTHPQYAGQLLAEMGTTGASRHIPRLAEPLSGRELEVLRLVVAGLSNREIARQLVVTPGTAKTHLHNICGKLGVRNRTEAAMRARELGLV